VAGESSVRPVTRALIFFAAFFGAIVVPQLTV